MIRINLLPFRLARKKENIRRQISVFMLLVFLSGVVLFWYTQMMNRKIQSVKNNTTQVNAQIAKYKEKAERVNQIKKDLKALDEKLKIMSSLKKQKDKQYILFDHMIGLIVPERMWLESMKTDDNTIVIKGIAFDNPTIADFMKNLEKSSLFAKVDLKTAKSKKLNNNVTLKSFELLCIKETLKQEKEGAKKQG